jgi:hypothetical protein
MNMKTSPNDVSNQEILEAMQTFAESVDKRFDRIDQRFENVEGRLGKVEAEMVTKDYLATELNKFKTTMVSKDYLDDKLADHYSDLVRFTRREIQRQLPSR